MDVQEELKLDEKKIENPDEEKEIYWEKQGISRLCGLHTINSILQGPFYNAVSLAEIAKELDLKEQKIMAELGTETDDYIKFMAQDSVNVAEDGNFSIQVLTEAVTRVAEVEIEPFSAKKALSGEADINNECAIIVNSHMHWFALRKINNIWYDLNSTNKYPEIMGEVRMTEFLMNCVSFDYLLFAVKGNFPDAIAEELNTKNSINQGEMQIMFKESFLKSTFPLFHNIKALNDTAEEARKKDIADGKITSNYYGTKRPANGISDEERIAAAYSGSGINPFMTYPTSNSNYSNSDASQAMQNSNNMPPGAAAGMGPGGPGNMTGPGGMPGSMPGNMPGQGSMPGPGNMPGPGMNNSMPPAAAGTGMANNNSGPGSNNSTTTTTTTSITSSNSSSTSNNSNTQKFGVERSEGADNIKIKFLFPDTTSMSYVFPKSFTIQDLYDYVTYRTDGSMIFQLYVRIPPKAVLCEASTEQIGYKGFVMNQEIEVRPMMLYTMW